MNKKQRSEKDKRSETFLSKIKDFWKWLNESDSWLATVLWIIIFYIMIRYLIYPVLGFFLGTPYPIVAIVSGSMEHRGSFDEWWNRKTILGYTQGMWYELNNITKEMFLSFHFKNGLNKGDVLILRGKKAEDINVGDVIVFSTPSGKAVIHRCVKKWEKDGKIYFQTKGDANPGVGRNDAIKEDEISQDRLIGVAWIRIPWLGYPKAWLEDLINWLRKL
ncbi:MAG: signal peptidase I [Candidatus Woesearchaeota archaeon]